MCKKIILYYKIIKIVTVKKGTVIFLLYLPFVRYLFDIPDDILNTGRNMKHT